MSWLNNLAARTENLLNKVDQAAGQALQRELNEKQHNTLDEGYPNSSHYYSPYLNSTNNQTNNAFTPQPSNTFTKLSHSSSVGRNLMKAADPDTELMDFLNSPNTISAPTISHHKSNSLGASKSEFQNEDQTDELIKDSNAVTSNKDLINSENQLLKNEINSLSRELQSIIGRLKSTQDELTDTRNKLNSQSRHLSSAEQILRESQSVEGDLRAAVSAKDTQLGILRVRLEEAEGEIEAKKKRIIEVMAERDSILLDHSQSTGVHGYALESLQEKLREVESIQQCKYEENMHIQEEFRNRIEKLESEKMKLESEMNNLQKSYAKEKANNSDLQHQLKTSKTHIESIRTEFATYKDKAGRILQSKEKLIASLKENGPTSNSSDGFTSAQQMHEYESLVQERDMLREELINTQSALESAKNEILDLETQSHLENESLREQNIQLEEQLAMERQKLEDCEQDILKNKQELRYLHEDFLRQKNSFQTRVEDRENEIQRLRNQLTAKSMSTVNTEELENRLHTLTESLIQKQTAVESLSTEKNSLLLQLERSEKQHREMEVISNNRVNNVNLSINDDEVRQRVPDFMVESPFDGRMTRKVKLAAGVIDKFSIRLGVFLRRYPIARMFIIIYIFLLHLWVMVVLLTYQPEIHDSHTPH